MAKIRADRETTQPGDLGMDIKLSRFGNTPQVFWSVRCNSFVVRDDGKIVSINGLGEIRWLVEDWNRDEESEAARAYFLEP